MTGYYEPQEISNFATEIFKSNNRNVADYETDARASAKSLDIGFKTVRSGSYQCGESYNLRIPRKAITTICAKSGGGKTTDLLNIAFNLRAKGSKGIYLTLEEPACDLFAKTMSLFTVRFKKCNAPMNFFECKKALAAGFEKWEHANEFKHFMDLDGLRFIDATKQHSPDDPMQPTMLQDPRFLNEILKVAADMGEDLDFIIIDYVQLMDAGSGFESSARNMKEVMQTLRYIVGHFSAAVIIGAQMNRQAAFTDFSEWQKEHLADGSEIEKSSNLIVALCLREVSGRGPQDLMMGLRVLKNRGGPVSLASLHEVDLAHCYIKGEGDHDPDSMG